MIINAEHVFSALPALSPNELQAVQARAAALLAVGPKDAAGSRTPDDGFAQELYEAIAALLAQRMQTRSTPFGVFRKTQAYRDHFLPAARVAHEAHAGWFPRSTNAQRASMVTLYAELILDHLRMAGLPQVWPLIARTATELPQIVDFSFPGYCEAGLLGMVLQRRTRVRAARK